MILYTKEEVRKISDKNTRTVNVYPEISDTDIKRIFKTRELYAKVFDEYAQWFCDNKTLSVNQAHHCLYHKQRTKHPELPSGLLQSARDKAKVAVKSYNSRNPKNNKFGKVPQCRSQSMAYNKRTSSLNTKGEFKFSLGYGKRVKVSVNIPKYFTDRYGNFEYQSSNIGIDKNGKFFIGLVFVKDKNPTKKQGKTVGIDRGIYNLVTTSEGMNISSSKVRGVKRKRDHQIRTLKEKVDSHSRSAKRRLNKIYGKESRFIRNVNHCISKSLAEDDSVKTYVLEDLTNIKFNKKKFPKKFRKLLHNWSPSQLAQFLEYKCELNGISIEYVDPRYTSQTCNKCGKVDKSQRKGHQYLCSCGNVDHADINAAKNIRDKVTTLPS